MRIWISKDNFGGGSVLGFFFFNCVVKAQTAQDWIQLTEKMWFNAFLASQLHVFDELKLRFIMLEIVPVTCAQGLEAAREAPDIFSTTS